MSDTFISQEYMSPITPEIMRDPVICNDSYIYERSSILKLQNNKSPMTIQLINKNQLIVNRTLKSLIQIFTEKI